MNENEVFAGKVTDLKNGETKEIVSGEMKILLAKTDDRFYAVGAICPHLQAPLSGGALCGTRLYCPWHHSSFDITNGHLCDPPAMDGLPRYTVRTEGEDVFVETTPINEIKRNEKLETTAKKTFVIVGGGAAGQMAAETLRSNGFSGRLIMITKENTAPYDRTLLSKKFMSGKAKPESLLLRKNDFFEKNEIELQQDKEVKRIVAGNHDIVFTDESFLQYDSLLIATGGQPVMPEINGIDLPGVFTLRSLADAEAILAKAKTVQKACIVGAGFIGMEMAASLTTLGLGVTVITREGLPFEKKFGKEVGELFYNLHKEKGVDIKTHAEVERITGKENAETVVLKSGERIETDMVVIGMGVQPATHFLQNFQLVEKDKSVMVDEQLKAAENIFAAGDITSFPDKKTGEPMRIEHWRLAQQHGHLAALNMMGKTHSVAEIVPFFWTNQFDKRLSYVGHATEWDEIIIDGNTAEQIFHAFYLQKGKVLAVASMGKDKESNKIEDAMRNQGLLTVAELKEKIKN